MSFDLKLRRQCDHRIWSEEHLVETDNKTVVPKYFVAGDDVRVRVNGYEWPKNNKIESLIIENVSSQFTTLNSKCIVTQTPICNGQNLKLPATSIHMVTVQVLVINEDDSSQFTGTENWFIAQHLPLLSEFNFSQVLATNDVEVTINGVQANIIDLDAKTGRITLQERPLSTDMVLCTYFYRAKILSINSDTGLIVIQEKLQNQQVKVQYYGSINNGWSIVKEIGKTQKKIVFDQERKTNRISVVQESVNSQLHGVEKSFTTKYNPLMPFDSGLYTTPSETLQNSVTVTINGVSQYPMSLDAYNGIVYLDRPPKSTDIVSVSYFYRSEMTPDVILIDYPTDPNMCSKCNSLGILDDYEYDNAGQVYIVENENKLVQDVRKITLTIRGSNAEHDWYGTDLYELIGHPNIPDIIKPQISANIQNAISDVKSLQEQQQLYQIVTDREFINTLKQLSVIQDSNDYELWTATAEIITQAGTIATLTETIQIGVIQY